MPGCSVLTVVFLAEACSDLRIDPKITIIVVGKRHHVRLVDLFIMLCHLAELAKFLHSPGSSLKMSAMLIRAVTVQLAQSWIARWHILPNLTFISKVTEVFSEPVAPPIIQCVFIDIFFHCLFST